METPDKHLSDAESGDEAMLPSRVPLGFVSFETPIEEWLKIRGSLSTIDLEDFDFKAFEGLLTDLKICTKPADIVDLVIDDSGKQTILELFSKKNVGEAWTIKLQNFAARFLNLLQQQHFVLLYLCLREYQ